MEPSKINTMYNRLHNSSQQFITDDFMLQNDFAGKLYHDHAKSLPILDYHNHLPSKEITDNHQFKNCTEVWLNGDHYKWRAMRTLGIDEKFITGNATDREKFVKWAETVPYTVRNPLYHWTHLELQRYFDVNALLSKDNADAIYELTEEKLQTEGFKTQNLLNMMNVEVVSTTDDPIDSLKHHSKFQQQSHEFQLLPSFRPDKAYAVENANSYREYLEKLEMVSNIAITSYADLIAVLNNRIEFFKKNGCKIADHGLERLHYFEFGKFDVENLFKKLMDGHQLNEEEIAYFKFETLVHLSHTYHSLGWVQQFHLGALRNTNKRMLSKLGPDTGFDSIVDFQQAMPLSSFLNLLDSTDQLAKTVIYNLNPADNEVFASMIGNFNDGSIKGKMQFGSAWWFLDQKDGMEKQLNSLSNLGLLSCFIGMLTDSRSFLSFPRHEYFRRILCNLIGMDVENGELPNDEKWLGQIVSDICYHNAKQYFGF
ncbi:glucuronate isomerase [Flagellimonas sp. 389]|uniref:glucuronate isomerase n=1 Tax=Flagellimonas sp. 389 TaxID=2835862 RepID=UPI002022FDC8|nr:glucuronate isomerase [Flagellimonas sp. 389]